MGQEEEEEDEEKSHKVFSRWRGRGVTPVTPVVVAKKRERIEGFSLHRLNPV